MFRHYALSSYALTCALPRCFTYRARMEFSPTGEAAEAGVSLFQKDDSYINLTVRKAQKCTSKGI